MFNWKEFERQRDILQHMAGVSYKEKSAQHHVWVKPNNLKEWMELLKEDLGFFTLVEIAANDEGGGNYEVVYHLLNMGNHQRVNLHCRIRSGEVLPTVRDYFTNADWMEREQGEMFNIKFNLKREGLLLPEGQTNFPLRKVSVMAPWPVLAERPLPKLRFNPNKSEPPFPEESYVWEKFSLSSRETRGNFEWDVCFDPHRVIDSRLMIGFHHQGMEKLLEQKDFVQILQLVDKINFSASPTYSIAWARTLEEVYRIKIPERAQALRIVLLELARVADHLTVIANLCREAGEEEFKLFINAREKVYELLEQFSGHRHALGLVRIGGLKEDLPPGWISEYQLVADLLNKNLKILRQTLVGNNKFRHKLEGEAINSQLILHHGVTGPAMRAAGLNFDLRKSQPFYFYQDIDFDIPVGIRGTIYDRFLIRLEEIFQSLRIITQVIDNLPLGSVINSMFDLNYLELSSVLEGHEKIGEWHYSSLEAPSGEAGFMVKFHKQGLYPSRIKLKTPGFTLASALPVFARGLRKDQLPLAVAGLGMSRWEMDR